MKKSTRISIVILAVASVGAVLYNGVAPLSEANIIRQLQNESLTLQVESIQQSQTTSCGEAAITMAYNHAYPESPIWEWNVIAYATKMGYFTADRPPFTSPADMVRIANNYSRQVASSRVLTQEQGLSLLFQKLRKDEPVIIDVLTRLNDPTAAAHFVVVTGISMNENQEDVILIHYNNPLTGQKESAPWSGPEGIWNAWQNNGDPGGAGWWMTIRAPS